MSQVVLLPSPQDRMPPVRMWVALWWWVLTPHMQGSTLAIPENREFQKWKLSFFGQRHTLLTSFHIFVITYRVTNFLPKLIDMLLFSTEKTEFPFLVFPYFRLCLLLLTHFVDSWLRWGPRAPCTIPTGRLLQLHVQERVSEWKGPLDKLLNVPQTSRYFFSNELLQEKAFAFWLGWNQQRWRNTVRNS